MDLYKSTLVINYFLNRGWSVLREGDAYIYLTPKKKHKYPQNFTIDIPKVDNSPAFNDYIDRIIDQLSAMTRHENTAEDLSVLFSRNISIFKYRIFDNETANGTISFEKHISAMESIRKAFSQTVTFVTTDRPIFANAKSEVEFYLNRCRTLQTEKGSFVSKIELPNESIHTAATIIETVEINNRLIDVLEFVSEEIIRPQSVPEINDNYLSDNKELINYELLQSIKEIYSKPKINNIDYHLSSGTSIRKISTEKVLPRITFFNSFLRDVKGLLLRSIPLDVIGIVKKLSSPAPKSSSKNEIIITAIIGNQEQDVKVTLRSDSYMEAIEAHKNENRIHLIGYASQGKGMFYIADLRLFEVMVDE